MQDAILDRLTQCGLTRNEGLAYVTLLEEPGDEGLTGYEVAARSGIPRSAVYAVLRKLERAGAAFPTGEKPARYLPTAPDRFVKQMRDVAIDRYVHLSELLGRLPKRADPEPVWVLSRYAEVMERTESMLRAAQKSIYLSLWPREVERLMPVFDTLGGRGLHMVLHCPDRLDRQPQGVSCWIDDVLHDQGKVGWSHKALVVVDREQALIGGSEIEADNHAVWTMNPSLVDVATNHIVLDITLISRRTGRDCLKDVQPMMRTSLPRHA